MDGHPAGSRREPDTQSDRPWHNVRMSRVRTLLRHPLAGVGLRFAITGSIVALVYIGTPVFLNGGAGVPIEVAIPIAYVLAVSLHFNLQRRFVFRHVAEFALSRRQQIGRYLMVGAVQYPTTAIATAVLPKVLGLSQRVTYVVVTLTMSLFFFVLLRTVIFHPTAEPDVPLDAGSRTDLEVAELEFLVRAGSPHQVHADAVEPPVDEDRQSDASHGYSPSEELTARGADADPLS
jgi:putative flippase GtrA